ncbi:MAG: hypothetical protein LBR22_00170 [Desulfovibrio sp.]|jgi:uncharacterized phage-associated protein|nr:hypothetical protein [Desulfovibrio sp.]
MARRQVKQDNGPVPVEYVAEFFIANADPDDPVTHLNVQNLCAYAQAYSLALLDSRLFEDLLLEFPHGPAIKALLRKYKCYGKAPLATSLTAVQARRPFSYEQFFVLEQVNATYGGYSPSGIRRKSHQDFPGTWWPRASRKTIPESAVKERFLQNPDVTWIIESANETS